VLQQVRPSKTANARQQQLVMLILKTMQQVSQLNEAGAALQSSGSHYQLLKRMM
jgi:hypothetical protein